MGSKEEVIKAIDKLINLENQIQIILSKYQDVILSYADNKPLSLDFEECDYLKNLLTRAKEDIINYWDEEHEESVFDDEINETLRLAGVSLNESMEDDEIKINDIYVDRDGKEYIVTEVDNTYGEDKYGQPAVYVSLAHFENGKKVGGGLGMPSTGMKHIFKKKQ